MIQIDMQMPKNCIDCPACNEYLMCAIPCNGRGWGENDVKEFSQSRPEWCPMKEQQPVKPMIHNSSADVWYYVCDDCNYPISPGDNYCGKCGKQIIWGKSLET